MITGVNDRGLVSQVAHELVATGITPLVFGGWAKELLDLEPARGHKDIDLLVIATTAVVDSFVAARCEVIEKRFSHKRAFIETGVLVELFLVDPVTGSTRFWDEVSIIWPSLRPVVVEELPVAPVETIAHYGTHYEAIHAGRR
jgi:hypothetical protein